MYHFIPKRYSPQDQRLGSVAPHERSYVDSPVHQNSLAFRYSGCRKQRLLEYRLPPNDSQNLLGNPRWGYAWGVLTSCSMHSSIYVNTQKIFAVLVVWYHHIVLTVSFKLVSFSHLYLPFYTTSHIQTELQPILFQILLPWQPGSLLLKFDWRHWMAWFQKSRLSRIYKTNYRRFCLTFRCHGNGRWSW